MTSRRTFIAGAAVAPFVPLSAAAEADPAVAAFRRWVEAARARQTFIPPNEQDWEKNAHALDLDTAEAEAKRACVEAAPTTAEGLAGKVHLMLAMSGFDEAHMNVLDVGDVETFHRDAKDESERMMLRCGLQVIRALRES